jgi:hypothetical protein
VHEPTERLGPRAISTACQTSAPENLDRLATALRELGARLRVGGMTDEQARQLPIQLDATTLRSFGSSTWMTDAGPIDILRELRDRGGADVDFEALRRRSVDTTSTAWWSTSLDSTTSSPRRNTPTVKGSRCVARVAPSSRRWHVSLHISCTGFADAGDDSPDHPDGTDRDAAREQGWRILRDQSDRNRNA